MAKMTFQKLDMQKGEVGAPFEVQFNPNEYGMTKGAKYAEVVVPGLDSPVLQFVNGENEKLTLELFFDTTDEKGTGADAVSVSTKLDAFYRLVKVDGAVHAPPIVRVTWGEEFPGPAAGENDQPVAVFDAVVENVQRKYTLFNSEGVPLRAQATVTLREYKTLEEQLQEINFRSSDHTRVHVVRQGETLPLIAYEAYQSAAPWRLVATHNKLLNPRDLRPGMVLHLPPLS
jgi:contractile injection system tube protein